MCSFILFPCCISSTVYIDNNVILVGVYTSCLVYIYKRVFVASSPCLCGWFFVLTTSKLITDTWSAAAFIRCSFVYIYSFLVYIGWVKPIYTFFFAWLENQLASFPVRIISTPQFSFFLLQVLWFIIKQSECLKLAGFSACNGWLLMVQIVKGVSQYTQHNFFFPSFSFANLWDGGKGLINNISNKSIPKSDCNFFFPKNFL